MNVPEPSFASIVACVSVVPSGPPTSSPVVTSDQPTSAESGRTTCSSVTVTSTSSETTFPSASTTVTLGAHVPPEVTSTEDSVTTSLDGSPARSVTGSTMLRSMPSMVVVNVTSNEPAVPRSPRPAKVALPPTAARSVRPTDVAPPAILALTVATASTTVLPAASTTVTVGTTSSASPERPVVDTSGAPSASRRTSAAGAPEEIVTSIGSSSARGSPATLTVLPPRTNVAAISSSAVVPTAPLSARPARSMRLVLAVVLPPSRLTVAFAVALVVTVTSVPATRFPPRSSTATRGATASGAPTRADVEGARTSLSSKGSPAATVRNCTAREMEVSTVPSPATTPYSMR